MFFLFQTITYLAVDTHPIHHAKGSEIVVVVFVVVVGQGITRGAGSRYGVIIIGASINRRTRGH